MLVECDVCKQKRYLVSERDDGTTTIQRCDNCAADILTDDQAQTLAAANGVCPTSKIVLGHKFRPMDKDDYDSFAGAEEGSYICESSNTTLILTPNGVIIEILIDQDGVSYEREWTVRDVF